LKWHNKLLIIELKNLVADGFTKDSQEEFFAFAGVEIGHVIEVDVVILTSDLVSDPVIGNIITFLLRVFDFTFERIKFDNIWGSLFSLLPEIDLEVF